VTNTFHLWYGYLQILIYADHVIRYGLVPNNGPFFLDLQNKK
jgi:hypothetical protein